MVSRHVKTLFRTGEQIKEALKLSKNSIGSQKKTDKTEDHLQTINYQKLSEDESKTVQYSRKRRDKMLINDRLVTLEK